MLQRFRRGDEPLEKILERGQVLLGDRRDVRHDVRPAHWTGKEYFVIGNGHG
jgi:hypothetical protein